MKLELAERADQRKSNNMPANEATVGPVKCDCCIHTIPIGSGSSTVFVSMRGTQSPRSHVRVVLMQTRSL